MSLFDLMDGREQVASDRPTLMPMQQAALEACRAAYAGGVRRVIVQAPCGSGKTIVASEQVRRAVEKGKTCLFLAHRRRLVDQAVWTIRKFGLDPAPLMEGRQTWRSNVYCASRDGPQPDGKTEAP
jgi:superfamily II DNA or RNA helicase